MKLNRLVWLLAALTFLLQLSLTGFFQFGAAIPFTGDVHPGNYRDTLFTWPPHGRFLTHYYLGFPNYAPPFDPVNVFAHWPAWLYFTLFFPLFATLAFLACYKLLRELEFSIPVACCSALFFAWGEDLLNSILPGHFPNPVLWACFPFALFLAFRSSRTGSFYLAACCGAFTGMMVSLLPDRGAICSLLVGVVFLGEGFREKKRVHFFQIVLPLFITIFVAVLVAYPAIDSIVQSHVKNIKAPGSGSFQERFDWATQWSFTPEDTLTYLFPGCLGWYQQNPEGPYWGRIGQSPEWDKTGQGFRNFCLASFSIGTIPTLCSLLGIFLLFYRRKISFPNQLFSPEQWRWGKVFTCTTLIFYILALGKYTPLYVWFLKIPFMDQWRDPLKFLMPVNMALIILSAYGLRFLSFLVKEPSFFQERKWVRLGLNSLALAFFLLWLGSFLFSFSIGRAIAGAGYSLGEMSAAVSTLHHSLFVATCSVVLLAFFWQFLLHPEKTRFEFINPFVQKTWNWLFEIDHLDKTWILACGCVAIAQLCWVQSRYIQLYDFKAIYSTNPFFEKIRPSEKEPFRVKVAMEDPLLDQILSTTFPYLDIPSIDIPAISRMPNDYAKFFESLKENPTRLYELAGVRYLVVPHQEIAQLQSIPAFANEIFHINYYPLRPPFDPHNENTFSHAVVEFKTYFPKAAFIPEAESFQKENDLLKRLQDKNWDPKKSILIDTHEFIPTSVLALKKNLKETASPANVQLQRYDDQKIEIEVDAPTDGYLLLNDRFDPHWKATINGKPVSLFHADFIFRGLKLPAGHSKISLVFATPNRAVYSTMLVWLLLAVGFPFWRFGATKGDLPVR